MPSEVRSSYDAFVFDCDGVLWKGSTPVEGAADMINDLRKDKKVVFATNNSLVIPTMVTDKLAAMGIPDVHDSHIVCPNSTVPILAKEHLQDDEVIGVIGGKHFTKAMTDAFPKQAMSWSMAKAKYFDTISTMDMTGGLQKEMRNVTYEELPSVFAIGYDAEINWLTIAWVVMVAYKREAKGLNTVVLQSNGDITLPFDDGLLPGAGALFAPYEVALANCSTCRIINCGKPEKSMADSCIQLLNVCKDRILMIGDNLLTDILFGNRHLGGSLMVLSGVHQEEDIQRLGIHPTHVLPSAKDL